MKIKNKVGLKWFLNFLSYAMVLLYIFFIIYLSKGEDNFIIAILHYIRKLIPSKDVADGIFGILIIVSPCGLILFLFNKISYKLSDFEYLSKF